ncbi:hypothetical protein [Streptomyces coffeae]|uniref:Uncharacterized protein n=1 Tax=Streptomyces coffeae TaxID=621382 RepID=A0ABS1NN19_9ACTN|nr:hypothetical protein [Streptomyces coffeae]MBL1101339.1 hypothetical protein [Streptomyces coffeae]
MDPLDPEPNKEADATLRTADRHQRRQMAERQMAAARGPRPYGSDGREPAGGPAGGLGTDGFGERFAFVGVSLVLAIPLSAIGAVNEGLAGLLVTWAGIVGVNATHAFGGLSRLRRGRREADGVQGD